MAIEEDIVNRMLADATIAGLVGVRIFPGQVPQGQPLPAIVFNVISRTPLYDDQGESGLDNMRIQIDSWSTVYTQARQVSRAVRASLSAWFDDLNNARYMELDNERDLQEAGSNEAEYRFRVSQDYMVLNRS